MRLTWTPNMATGIASMDAEHRNLIAAHNDLVEALADGVAADVAASLGRLLAMTQDHFRHEEDVMRATAFSGLSRHEVEHDLIITEFYNARHRLLGGVIRTLDPAMMRQFKRWFVDHVTEMDFDYVAHLLDHGVE